MKYSEIQAQDRRFIILQALKEDCDYAQNDQILKSVLASVGHNVSDVALTADIAWLSDAQLVTTEWVSDLCVVTLTRRGEDVATGATIFTGVKRPRPQQ